jgi:hypothetical protein
LGISERTLKKAPQKPPTAVVVNALDPSTIVVTWRYVAPSIDEEALSGYRIRIWEADQDITKAKDEEVTVGSRLEKTITGLQPGKMYVLRVLAFSRGGDGKMSSPAKEFILGPFTITLLRSSIFLSKQINPHCQFFSICRRSRSLKKWIITKESILDNYINLLDPRSNL